MSPPDAGGRVIGWDVGGAHVKACLVEDGTLRDAAQWPCPLWQGLQQLDHALDHARERWPQAWEATTRHVATMTGEMVDLFANREVGVVQLADRLAERLGSSLRLYAPGTGWVAAQNAARHWPAIASANWRASAELLARRQRDALLVDIGSTTTDLVPVRDGCIAALAHDDATRLASGELVYQGVVRTPLCALAPRVRFGGQWINVMNEFFATSADIYRLTGELDPTHDQQPAADHGAKDAAATRQRLARMIGRDARDADDAAWLALAQHWSDRQLDEIEGQALRVVAQSGLPSHAPVVAAGCGAFLVATLAARLGRRCMSFSHAVQAGRPAELALSRWAGVCAPALSVALLADAG